MDFNFYFIADKGTAGTLKQYGFDCLKLKIIKN